MDSSGDQLDESTLPRVITSPPPPENPTGLEAPPAPANSSLSNTTVPPLQDRGPGRISEVFAFSIETYVITDYDD